MTLSGVARPRRQCFGYSRRFCMKKFIIISLLFIAGTSCFAPSAIAELRKNKIAVLPFSVQGEKFETDDMGKIVSEWLITAFVKDGRFEVVERRLLGQVLEEQKMVDTGIVSQEAATEIGRILGVKVIITGSVMKLTNAIEVNARIIDVSNASIVTAEYASSPSVSGLHHEVIRMAKKIMKNFPLQGYVVNRKEDSVMIDLGSNAGVKPGMRFMAYREGEPVRHPRTGKVIYIEKKKTGTIRITSTANTISKGVIIEETPENAVKYGNLVESIKDDADETPADLPSAPGQQASSSLYVHTVPPNARVRILNIKPPYKPGMSLRPGAYLLEASAPGYVTEKQWITIKPGEARRVEIGLRTAASPYPAIHRPPRTELDRYIAMLESSDSRQVRRAAKYLAKRYSRSTRALQAARRVLLSGCRKKSDDRHYVDALAYLCKMLGKSHDLRYKEALETVAKKAKAKKLRKYASKSLEILENK